MENLQKRRRGPSPPGGDGLPFAAAFQAMPIAMCITDAGRPDQPIVFVNDAFLHLTGYEAHEVVGRNCRFLQGPETNRSEVARLADAVAAGRPAAFELLNYRKDGSAFWNALSLSPMGSGEDGPSYILGLQQDVTARRAAYTSLAEDHAGLRDAAGESAQDLQKALQQKTALLHEVDHRVKNNLQLVASLLLLQSRRIDDKAARAALHGMLERVSAIATVHRRLFQSADIERFDVAEFVRDLTADLMAAADRSDVEAALDLERVDVPASQAAPIALVVNELLCNALKHAFPPGRGGRIEVSIRRSGDSVQLKVRDDGQGFDVMAPPNGFGLTIVGLLCVQLRADFTLQDAQPGVRALVTLAMNTDAPDQ